MKKFLVFSFLFLFLPTISNAGSLDLKATSDKIVDYELYASKEGEDIVEYTYKTKEVPVEPYEDIDKRTPNSQFFGNKQRIFLSNQFIKESEKWLQVETATTTLKTWNEQYSKPFTLIPIARADTYYVGDGGHGYLAMNAEGTWSSAHDSTSAETLGNTQTVIYIDVNRYSASSYYIYRAFIPVDTSAIADDCSIETAKFYFYPTRSLYTENDENAYVGIVQTTVSDPTTLTNDDYNDWTATEAGTGIRLEDLTVNAYNYIEFNATGISWINKTGWTKLAILEGHDINDDAPTQTNYEVDNAIDIRSSRYADTTYDPYLEITCGTSEPPVEPTLTASSTANMYIEYITYNATSTQISSTTSVVAGIYHIPFILYIFVLTGFAFTVLIVFFFLYLIKYKK